MGESAYTDLASMTAGMRWGYDFRKYALGKHFGDGTGVRVAILDTGIDPDHPCLNNILSFQDFTLEGIEDFLGFGTIGAGIIAGNGQDNGFLGMAPKTELIIGKIFSEDWYIETDAIRSALDWALSNRADIIVFAHPVSSDMIRVFRDYSDKALKGQSVILTGTTPEEDSNSSIFKWSNTWGKVSLENPLGKTKVWSTNRLSSYSQQSLSSQAVYIVAGLMSCIMSEAQKYPFERKSLSHEISSTTHFLSKLLNPKEIYENR